jgi:PqqD family protein of HPr-rel-A system
MAGQIYIADMEGARRVVLEGLTLLFHPASGMTHILAPPSPEILAVLAETGDADAVLARLGETFAFAPGEGLAAIEARLAELEASGLVRRA